VVKVAFSVRLFTNIFLGKEPKEISAHFHAPSLALQLPPVLLAAAALLFGLFPMLLDRPLSLLAVEGLNRPQPLALWHGHQRTAGQHARAGGRGHRVLVVSTHPMALAIHTETAPV
jgi:NADH:ubiquinone oxidoreductase subunit 5 (subunit L)/multisubunit Na+/H+ antiporter MnhA subunit